MDDEWVAVESDVAGKTGMVIPPAVSAYGFFQRENGKKIAAQLKAEGKPSSVGDIGQAVSAKWKELTSELRAPYEELAREDKLRYQDECAARDAEILAEQEARRAANAVGGEVDGPRAGKAAYVPKERRERRPLTGAALARQQERRAERRAQAEEKRAVEAEIAAQRGKLEGDIAAKAQDRLKYLLAQSDIFQHFGKMDAGGGGGGGNGGGGGGGGADGRPAHLGRRKEESEEDQEMLQEDIREEGGGTFLLTQPACIRHGTMRPYQLEGLNWMIRLQENGINGILADEMGLGKTLQSISILGYTMEYRSIRGPHIVLVPKSTLSNWMNEFQRWCPDIRAIKFHGNKDERKELVDTVLRPGARAEDRDWDVLVTTYEVANMERTALGKFAWRYLVVDEAHRLKNESSMFSQTVRSFAVEHRLLITGTPLQNNLHELWALLNFLLPDVFSSSEQFDEWFNLDVDDAEAKRTMIQQLHKILRPFMLRRLKADVEGSLPPKTETILYTGMSEMQKNLYKQILLRDIDVVNGATGTGGRTAVLNIVMQLRKCCGHPYLFAGVEDRTLDPLGEHLVQNCGKMVLLDKLLVALKERGHRVLIFSQMTRMLDIFEDYMVMRGWGYCRIDGNTSYDLREDYIDAYNAPGSEKFVFLLSTRAGGLGINLQTADTVILYDSDWNPQADLQAQDRAHRIGQKRPVSVYRLVTENTIEEKVVERAQQKLKLDAMVVQQGRLQEKEKKVSKDDLLSAVRFGADQVFRSKESTITDEDIDAILERGKNKTAELQEKIQASEKGDLLDFRLDGGFKSQEFEGVDYGDRETRSRMLGVIDIGKRERKKVVQYQYADDPLAPAHGNAKAAAAAAWSGKKRSRLPRAFRLPRMDDWQWFAKGRLEALHAMEERKFAELKAANALPADVAAMTQLLDDDLHREKVALLAEGFPGWLRQHYSTFCRASARHGRDAFAQIAQEVEKPVEEVAAYAAAFWKKGPSVIDPKEWDRVTKNIEKGERRIQEVGRLMAAARRLLAKFRDPWEDLTFQYVGQQGRVYNIHEDRFLLCATVEHGYGNWGAVRAAARRSDRFRFDYFMQACTAEHLGKRCEHLLRLAEKECAEWEKRYSQAAADGGAGASLAGGGEGGAGMGEEEEEGSGLQATGGDGEVTALTAAARGRLREPRRRLRDDARALAEARLDGEQLRRRLESGDLGGLGVGGGGVTASGGARGLPKSATGEYRNRRPVTAALLPALARAVARGGHTSLEGLVLAFHTLHPAVSKRQIELKVQEIAFKAVGPEGNLRGEWMLKPEFEYLSKEGATCEDAEDAAMPLDPAGGQPPAAAAAGKKRKAAAAGAGEGKKKKKKPAGGAGGLPPALVVPAAPAGVSGDDEDDDDDDELPPTPRTAFEIFTDENRETAEGMLSGSDDADALHAQLKNMWKGLAQDDVDYYNTEAENEAARYTNAKEALGMADSGDADPAEYSIPKKKKQKGGEYSIPKKKKYNKEGHH